MTETEDQHEASVAVLIADDQALVDRLRAILEEQPGIRVVGEAGDGRERSTSPPRHPDVVLMDIRMPDSTASKPPARSSPDRRHRQLGVLMLTTFDLDEYVYDALRAGASGFLLKDVPPEQLHHARPRAAAATPSSHPRSPAA